MADQQRKLNIKRGALKRQLNNFFAYVRNIENETGDLSFRYEKIQQIWKDFEDINIEIECLLDETDETAIINHREIIDSFENNYYEAIQIARNKLIPPQVNPPLHNTMQSQNQTMKIRLPPLTIKPFSGKYEHWLSFKDTFQKAVHNQEDIPNVQKFQMLRGLLTDDALKVISALEATDANYIEAWNLLQNRYANTRLITNTHIKGLFDCPIITKANQNNLRSLVDSIRTHLRSLQSLDQPVKEWSTILIYMIASKLDNLTREEWEREVCLNEQDLPNLDEFLHFLEKRCTMHEMINRGKCRTDANISTNILKKEKKVALLTTSSSNTSSKMKKKICSICNQQHDIYQCNKFLELTIEERCREIEKHKLCWNCLKSKHGYKECRSSSCRKCGRKHNTLIHKNQTKDSEDQGKINCASDTCTVDNQLVAYCVPKQSSRVLLSTALMYLQDINGIHHEIRVLLDPGAQVNILIENVAKRLKLKTKNTHAPITVAIDPSSHNLNKSATISLKSRISSFSMQTECLIAPSIIDKIRQIDLTSDKLTIPAGIELADPNFQNPGPIDLLLGAGPFWKVIISGENISLKNQPTYQNTQFGWIVGGEFTTVSKIPSAATCNMVIATTLYDQIEKFWKIEDINSKQEYCEHEAICEKHFQNTYKRKEDGRFEVELPQDSNVILGESYPEAFRRLKALERRFCKQPLLKQQYSQFLAEYEAAGHMSCQQYYKPENEHYYYMPHQPVIRKSSLTTKLRVVFDASAKTNLGISLNDRLLPGPNLQRNIFDILLRFRMYPFVITADITQMFRQILVSERDRSLQLILWRKDTEKPVKVYSLNTVTYGTTCAPFLAMRCLRELAATNKEFVPKAAEVLENDFYMDDLITGTSTIEEAITLQMELSTLLETGKFHLRKWRSNDPKILQHLKDASTTDNILTLCREDSIKTLGLLWNSKLDVLQYNIQNEITDVVTKRKILSSIAKIYDPLGLVSPVTIISKILMQELWKLKIGWDIEVPPDLKRTWNNYFESLNFLPELQIPRHVKLKNFNGEVILHGFSDASEKAYGACVYVLSMTEEGFFKANLLCSKSRVAPLKNTITLPRLELCAATELAKLISVVKISLKCVIKETHLWSDSTIVLHWIENPPIKKIFERIRVNEIRKLATDDSWHYVPTKENPADLISRGVHIQKLSSSNLWWNGPQWLAKPDEWPVQLFCPKKIDVDSKGHSEEQLIMVATTDTESSLLNRFSRFSKLKRTVAYCIRFVHNLRIDKLNESRWKGPLSSHELELARIQIIKWVQEETFHREITLLKAGKSIGQESPVLALNPFIDRDSIMRVGGRLRNADISLEQKHPAILPSNHHITFIIMRDEHVRLKHCGPHQLLYSIRQLYWPLSGDRIARKVTRGCISCFRYKPKVSDVLMGDLPKCRVNLSSRPFETTGVDYAGPLMIRESKRRGRIYESKGYIAVFTCFTTKAVHLELVTDLTSEAFIAAMRRFVARRGLCTSMFSDNATNFVGAARELRELFEFLEKTEGEIRQDLANRNITWNFIPPRSPHFGGLWEAAVKSVKKHLYTITAGLRFTFEEYYTLLVEIEAVLNSRPLSPISPDPNDLNVLTPGHFLIGSSLLEPVSKDFLIEKVNRLFRWQHIRKLKQHFWNRWQKEYLHHLQTRSKWKTGENLISIGTMVLIMDENQPPLYWKLGRVENTVAGADNVVRVVDVKTAQGTFRRCVKKLCLLPFEN